MREALPPEAITLSGGCPCRAVRYRMTIPAKEHRRVIFPAGELGRPEGEDILYPLMLVCHCNDCRQATANFPCPATMCPMDWVSFTFLLRSTTTPDHDGSTAAAAGSSGSAEDGSTPEYVTAAALDIIKDPDQYTDGKTFFASYQSPKKKPVKRWFCARCGGNAGYTYYPMPYPRFVPSWDFYLGGLDREDIERIRVDAHVWWDFGIEWVQRWHAEGDQTILDTKAADGKPLPLPRFGEVDFTKLAVGWGHKKS